MHMTLQLPYPSYIHRLTRPLPPFPSRFEVENDTFESTIKDFDLFLHRL